MKQKRIMELQNYVKKKGSVTLKELSNTFNVSLNTIRRDVNQLEENGYVKKVYGGVTSLQIQQLTPFNSRETKNSEYKVKIGEIAASYITDGDLIFIDSGTTTSQIFSHLNPNIQLTVLTNNLDVILQASTMSNIEIIVLGNRYSRETRSFIPTLSANFAYPYNVTKAFMSTTGLSIDNGLTNSDFQELEIKKFFSQKSNQIYLLADESKFDKASLITYSSLKNIDKIFTNKLPSKKYLAYFKENNTAIITP